MGTATSHAVYWAAQGGRLEDLRHHLRTASPEDLGPSSLSDKHQSPIHAATIAGHSECIRVLSQAGSKLNKLDKDGCSALHLAVAHCHVNCVKVLLRVGAKPNVTNRFGITPLHLAASNGHLLIIEELVREGANFNAQESWGQTPLIITTQKHFDHCMKSLLHMGADTELKDHHHGSTALHTACSSKDEEHVLILLDASADVLATNAEGQSPLGIALVNKHYHLVPLLIEYGARLNEVDRQHMPQKLLDYIDDATDTPHSLLRMCRVTVRQMLGPTSINSMLPTFQLPSSLAAYMQQVQLLCDGTRIREVTMLGAAEEYFPRRRREERPPPSPPPPPPPHPRPLPVRRNGSRQPTNNIPLAVLV